MKSPVRKFLWQVRSEATRREERRILVLGGHKRWFRAYDRGADTFVFEREVWKEMDEHASVLIVPKRVLTAKGGAGYVMTVTTGNHAVAAIPLLKGDLWDLADVPIGKRSALMTEWVLAANAVHGKLEISQRDIPFERLDAADHWLTHDLKFSLADVVFAERNGETLARFRARGQEWRVKPLAWTAAEMQTALAASRKRIASAFRYYHSAKGVHFLSYPEFHAFVQRAAFDPKSFLEQLRELAGVFEGEALSNLRIPKFRMHHEIELFGLRPGDASASLVPSLEALARAAAQQGASPAVCAGAMELESVFRTQLVQPELADEASPAFIRALYMHLTGEVYEVEGEGTSPAFDDRRVALPGATFEEGRPVFHPGCDDRSEVLISNLRAMMSQDEAIEYANVYELKSDSGEPGATPDVALAAESTREVVFKTNRRPLTAALVEKRLSRAGDNYGGFVLARIEAFKALGVALPDYRLLRRRARKTHRMHEFYIRTRCEGDSLRDIPLSAFRFSGGESARKGEDPRVACALAELMGEAAADNLAMKKCDPSRPSCLYGEGKEIYRFGWDRKTGRNMPLSVSTCSIRGACGWPCPDLTESNFAAAARMATAGFARTFARFAAGHPAIARNTLAAKFREGFIFRTRALVWRYKQQRDAFEQFDPALPVRFGFAAKWRFVLAALLWQNQHVEELAERATRPEGVRS